MTIRPHLILCAVDFSEDSRQALSYAAELAALHRATLVVQTAIDPLLASAAARGVAQDYVRDTRSELADFTARALSSVAGAPQPRLVVTIGSAAAQILDVSAFYQADLIVLGSQGLGRLERPLFGSTTDEVLRRTTIPVLVVPAGAPPLLAAGGRAGGFGGRHVLAAVDLHGGSIGVAEAGADLARLFSVPLVLAHVVPPVEAPARWSDCSADATRMHAAVAEIDLERLAMELDAPVVPLIAIGQPAEAITRAAAAHDAGVIVMGVGSADAGSVQRFGSTAARVLSFATVPVLAVPPFSAGSTERTGWSLQKEVTA
jgi:nucleotide-binding universal stress UspA family protein